jgi:hypothetical protein
MLTAQEAERFWSKVNKTESCWLWQGASRGHYGAFKLRHRVVSVHRLSWEIHFGEIPDFKVVCHSCDVEKCVNPEHLFLGTSGDNMRDASRKGRLEGKIAHNRKLDAEAIYQIRFLSSQGISAYAIAKQLGMAKSTIQNIINRKTYR